MRAHFMILLVALFLLPLGSAPLLAATEDIGNIAVIEDTAGTILEMPSVAMPNVYLANVACEFYKTHEDVYDALFVFNNSATVVQQGWSTQNTNEGIGRPLFDWTGQFCANQHRLRITVSMGNVTTLPQNPDDPAPIVPFYPLTGSELMAHEFGHHWLAAVTYDKNDGKGMQCLLRGYEPSGEPQPGETGDCSGYPSAAFNQHWSYYFNSCSLMYGSCIEDKQNGTFTFSYPKDVVKYSQLDQYLMGLRAPEEVDPLFAVVNYGSDSLPEVQGSASIPMQHSSSGTVEGTRVDFTIDDIIRSVGARNPASDTCHWKAAFILVHPAGQPPLPVQIDQMEAYRARWETFYDWATDNRGSFDTTLDGCGTGTKTCAGEQSPQCGANTEDGDEPGDCLDGSKRCDTDDLTVLQCVNASWVPFETCEDACVNGACADAPADGDEPTDGDTPSDGDDVKPDGDTPDGDQPADGDTPDGDTSTDGDLTSCSAGAGECRGEVFWQCNFNGDGYDVIDDCADNGLECSVSGCIEPGSGATGGGCQSLDRRSSLLLLGLALLLGLYVRRQRRT